MSQSTTSPDPLDGLCMLRTADVCRLTALSRTTIWRILNKPGNDFPKPIKLSRIAIGWRAAEVYAWLATRERVVYAQSNGEQETESTPALSPPPPHESVPAVEG